MNSLRIAFIAQFAPPVDRTSPVKAIDENMVYSRYHYDIYKILSSAYPNVITGTNAQFLADNHHCIDYVFSLLNRANYRNSEIFISALAEYYQLAYLGARPNVRAVAEDKQLAKIVAEACKIKTPPWVVCDAGLSIPEKALFLGPYFVKPRYGASSKLIDERSVCQNWDTAKHRIRILHSHGVDAIVEQFIEGINYTSPIYFKNRVPCVLPPVREVSDLFGGVITYRQKRKTEQGFTRNVEDTHSIIDIIEHASTAIAKYTYPVDYLRVDYILTRDRELYFLEFNVCCNLGVQSAFIQSSLAAGLDQKALVYEILAESLARQGIGGT